jgi:hypothetical protein
VVNALKLATWVTTLASTSSRRGWRRLVAPSRPHAEHHQAPLFCLHSLAWVCHRLCFCCIVLGQRRIGWALTSLQRADACAGLRLQTVLTAIVNRSGCAPAPALTLCVHAHRALIALHCIFLRCFVDGCLCCGWGDAHSSLYSTWISPSFVALCRKAFFAKRYLHTLPSFTLEVSECVVLCAMVFQDELLVCLVDTSCSILV